ncbi:cupredoxin family copper-binding protein [Candidatus Woesearchaeota archaeon]|nr:cupredoxin family copper-binding protein [Candidatus Woesearchaeota archaeon]
MKKAVIAISILLFLFIAGCSQQQAASSPLKLNLGQEVTVVIKDFKFNPAAITVKPGTTIVWENQDKASHTVKLPNWESEELFQGSTTKKTLTDPGTYNYVCGIHPSMKGTIIVE